MIGIAAGIETVLGIILDHAVASFAVSAVAPEVQPHERLDDPHILDQDIFRMLEDDAARVVVS